MHIFMWFVRRGDYGEECHLYIYEAQTAFQSNIIGTFPIKMRN